MPREHAPRPEHCIRCARPVYPQAWRRIKPDAIPEGGTAYGAHGYCAACYKAIQPQTMKPEGVERVTTLVFDVHRLPLRDPEDRARAVLAYAIGRTGGSIVGIHSTATTPESVIVHATLDLRPECDEAALKDALIEGLAAYARPAERRTA